MTADEAIDYANEQIALNAQVNGSHFANAAVAKAAEVASKLIDIATQLKALQEAPAAEESPVRKSRKSKDE